MIPPIAPQLVWNESLMTGVPEIDEQHMILVHTLNQASDKLSQDAGLEVLEPITRDLLSYALYHFETEEDLMQHYGYDVALHEDAKLHLEQHRSFSAKVVSVRENLKLGILIPPSDLVGFLNGWLVNHILNPDQRLGDFIVAKRAKKGG